MNRQGRIRAPPTRERLRHPRPRPTRRTRSRPCRRTSRPSRSPRPTRGPATPRRSPSSSSGSKGPASVASTKPSVSLRTQVQDAQLHLRRQVPLRPGPLLLRARRVRIKAAAGALVAARVQDEALPLRRLGVPLLRGRPLPVRAHGPRAGVPRLRTESRVCVPTRPAESAAVAPARDDASCRWRGLARHHRRGDDASRRWRGTRSTPPTQVEELQYLRPPPAKTQDKKYKTRMCRYGAGTCPYGVSCSYAHSAVVFRAEKSTLRAVDAKAGRSARRRSSGRSRPTSRRASRPTS